VRTLFEVVTENGEAYLDPFSPTHALDVRRDGARLTVRVEDELSAGSRCSSRWRARRWHGPRHAPPHREEGYFMLTLAPGRNAGPAEPRT